MAQLRAEILATGRVQGVCFRHYTQQTAEQYGITGWVRNRPDGSVEAVFEGDENAVRNAVDWCRSGPDYARVDDLWVKWEEATGEFNVFSVRN